MIIIILFLILVCLLIILFIYKPKNYEKLTDSNNSVVQIISNISPINWSEPYNTTNFGKGSGSGFFIDKKHIITNYHVIENTSNIVLVHPTDNSGNIIYGELIGIYPELDIALLSAYTMIEGKKTHYENTHFLTFGNSDNLKKEDITVAIGYPFSLPEVSHTTGVFSTFQDGVIQTTAAINPGNSGGPLLNKDGLVIGINFAGINQADNIGFAIPINDVKVHLEEIKINNTIIKKPILGGTFTRTNKYFVQNKCDSGTTVVKINKDGPLDNLNPGDILCKLDDNKIDNNGNIYLNNLSYKLNLHQYLINKKINSTIKLDYFSISKNMKITENIIVQDENINHIKSFYKNFNTLDYEIIGGFIIMELTKDHIINFMFNLNINQDELKNKKLIITSKIILDQYTIDQEENLLLPIIINKVNDRVVSTLTTLREVLKSPYKLNGVDYLYILTNDDTKFFEKMSVINNNNKIIQKTEKLRPV